MASQLRLLCKRAGITPLELSAKVNIPLRSLSYHLNSPRIPFVIIYKISVAMKLPIDKLIPHYVANGWLSTYTEEGGYKKSGHKNLQTKKALKESESKMDSQNDPKVWTKDLELSEPQAEPPKPPKITTKKEGPIIFMTPDPLPPPSRKTIAEIMKDQPKVPETAPNFGNVDSLFKTSESV